MIIFAVARSILLTSSNYDAFEANGTVRVCAVMMVEAIERIILVQLTSQDSTAQSKTYGVFSLYYCKENTIPYYTPVAAW